MVQLCAEECADDTITRNTEAALRFRPTSHFGFQCSQIAGVCPGSLIAARSLCEIIEFPEPFSWKKRISMKKETALGCAIKTIVTEQSKPVPLVKFWSLVRRQKSVNT